VIPSHPTKFYPIQTYFTQSYPNLPQPPHCNVIPSTVSLLKGSIQALCSAPQKGLPLTPRQGAVTVRPQSGSAHIAHIRLLLLLLLLLVFLCLSITCLLLSAGDGSGSGSCTRTFNLSYLLLYKWEVRAKEQPSKMEIISIALSVAGNQCF
jgi:hypothetical protein